MITRILFSGLLVLVAALGTASAQTSEPLILRVNDATAAPGELAAVVVRTYSSRPIRQGQICFFTVLRGSQPGSPFTGIEGVRVFSTEDDSWHQAEIDAGNANDPVVVRIGSPTSTINATDGPVLVVYLRLRKDLAPGTEYDVSIDIANSFLINRVGEAIPIAPRGGQLRVAHPGAALEAAIEADYWERPNVATLSLNTKEIRALSGGQIGLRYPMRVMRGHPAAFVDPRYGVASAEISWIPGLLLVSFESPDHSLNTLPGDIVSIVVETQPPQGVSSVPLILDPAHTWLRDAQGGIVPITIENDVLEFE